MKENRLSEANTESVTTIMDPYVEQVKDDSYRKKVDLTQYRSMVGSLFYAAWATYLDIAYAVGLVSKFNAARTQADLTIFKRIFRYPKGIIDLEL